MNDDVFISKLNQISMENKLRLPPLKQGNVRSGKELSRWAKFLELCVRKGLSLGDSRWARVVVACYEPITRFKLKGTSVVEKDTDFRVGLQLLIGLLDGEKNLENRADENLP